MWDNVIIIISNLCFKIVVHMMKFTVKILGGQECSIEVGFVRLKSVPRESERKKQITFNEVVLIESTQI